MGYYTDFNLAIIEGPDVLTINPNQTNFDEDFRNITGYHLDELINAKWYDYNNNMIKLSQMYPTSLFLLEGIGEEGGDYWRTYYYNGNYQRIEAKIIFDSPDLQKLKGIT